MTDQEYSFFQLKSILIVRYVSCYAKLEKLILKTFQDDIISVDHQKKNKLYFYYGIHVGNVYYNFANNRVCLVNENTTYDTNEMFKSLNLNKVVKFEKNEHLLDLFNIEITSILRPATSFPILDCCEKLISMRNKLAHETDQLQFKDTTDVIERLTSQYLKEYENEYTKQFELDKINDDLLIAILSNLIYIEKIEQVIQNK